MSDIVEVMAEAIAGAAPGYGHRVNAQLALAALEAAGFAVVPVVPTEKMKRAGDDTGQFIRSDEDARDHSRAAGSVWKAMLSASKAEGDS